MHSSATYSMENNLYVLSLNEGKAEENQYSYESGIASLIENCCIQTERTDVKTAKTTVHFVAAVKQNDNSETGNDNEKVCGEVTHLCESSVCLRDGRIVSDGRRQKGDTLLCWDDMCAANFPDKDGDTVLHLAVLHAVSQLDCLVQILGLQDQANARNRLFQTPLHLAVLTANVTAVSLLLRLGASLSAQDCHGNTPLHSACQRGDLKVLETLLQAGGKAAQGEVGGAENYDGAEDCAGREKAERHDVRSDLNHNVGVGVGVARRQVVAGALSARNYEGLTCLHLAVTQGRPDMVALLLSHGADVNTRDGKSGRTALHLAVDRPHPQPAVLATLLVHPRLAIDAANFARQTALQLARGRCHHHLVTLLHVHGADWSAGFSVSSEEDMDDDLPYDDICLAGRLVSHTKTR